MRALTCPLPELSASLQARTLYQHTVFGIARYLTSPAELPQARHPLEFSFLLGLSSKVDWYPAFGAPLLGSVGTGFVLNVAANYWERELHELDMGMLAVRLRAVAEHDRYQLCEDINLRLLKLKGVHDMKELAVDSKLPKEVYDRLEMSLASLEAALIAKDPMMPQHLRNSHAVLVSYPETVNLLRDEEIATLIDAAEIHTKTEVVKAVASGKGKSDKGLKKLTVSDL